jgi:hypothetical protein
MPQTTAQILRCLTLGGYAATVEGGELRIRGPQPLAGPLPASIKARRDELVDFLNEWSGGVWPPAAVSGNPRGRGIPSLNVQTTKKASAGELSPWDTEWATEKAADALRYLGRNYPECLENLRALDEHETAAYEAAMRGDREAYLEALRSYMRAGRDEALRIRRGAA